ncbi:cell envelope biogenesis protein TolA [Nocardiopsis sp. EMB25]|uniref:cell envelope biogenesis protein TolA n=1 Tax=Nocardiopsis sp. EMB25 TaxID=2835867 RepID=UPI002283F322|nr:cell envelope biogenesis protein TolA [Nocardiopsis sp. EMB25]MCY9786721.1 cell envelope biogenesis protein TolA [Nocardiopsis sp. EMB25]
MKFELVEPPEEGLVASEQKSEHSSLSVEDARDPYRATGIEDRIDVLRRPVRERMARPMEGVRASLDLLMARVAEQSMAEARDTGSPPADVVPEFPAHRFTSSGGGGPR